MISQQVSYCSTSPHGAPPYTPRGGRVMIAVRRPPEALSGVKSRSSKAICSTEEIRWMRVLLVKSPSYSQASS